MILVDTFEDSDKNKRKNIDILTDIRRLGVKADAQPLAYGDYCFEGNGPNGTISVGVERKTLHDMLNCIDDSRYSGHQRIGMKSMYTLSVLMVEGHWKPHDNTGYLMEGFSGGINYGYCKHNSSRILYAKLYRYLISVSLSGVIVDRSRDPFNTAYSICEWYHYFQKSWAQHTALRELPKVAVPTLNSRPSLTRKWAFDIEGIGAKKSEIAAQMFKTPIALANADEQEWLRVPGVGVKTAQEIVREVNGWRR